MKLYLLRHAQRKHGKKQDQLTLKGKLQALKLKKILSAYNFDKVYCANTNRAKKTIQPFLKKYKKEVIFTNQLNEMELGILQGKTAKEFREAIKKSGLSKDKFRPSNGENKKDFEKRIKNFIKELKKESKENDKILISTHAGVIRLFLKILKNKEIEKINFASIYVLNF